MDLSLPENLQVIDHLLTTTRSVRRRLDFSRPVEPDLIRSCLEIAVQAPTASNNQNWHFLVVSDGQKRKEIAGLYRKSFSAYIVQSTVGAVKSALSRKQGPRPDLGQMARVRPVI